MGLSERSINATEGMMDVAEQSGLTEHSRAWHMLSQCCNTF